MTLFPSEIIVKLQKEADEADGSVIDPIHESDGNADNAGDGKSNSSDKSLSPEDKILQVGTSLDWAGAKTNPSAIVDVHCNKERNGAYDPAQPGWGEERQTHSTSEEGKWNGNRRNRTTPAQKRKLKLDISRNVDTRPANSGYYSYVPGNSTLLLDAKADWPTRPRRYSSSPSTPSLRAENLLVQAATRPRRHSASPTTPSLRAENLLVQAAIDAGKEEEVDAKGDSATRPRRYSGPPCTPSLPAPKILAQGAIDAVEEELDTTTDWPTRPRRSSAPPVIPFSPASNLLHQAVLDAAEKEEIWHYMDPNGMVQGPFALDHFRKCNTKGQFHENMRLWTTSKEEFISLHDALGNAPSIKQWRTLFVGSLLVWLRETLARALTGSLTLPLTDPAAKSPDSIRETGEASSLTDREGLHDGERSTSWEGRDVDQNRRPFERGPLSYSPIRDTKTDTKKWKPELGEASSWADREGLNDGGIFK